MQRQRDPSFALPYAGLADAMAVMAVYNLRPPATAFPRARSAAHARAVELDDRLAEAHASLGHVATQFDRDWREGERLYRLALALRPSYAQAVMWLANNHLMQGRIPEALSEARQAQLLEPMSLSFAANVGMVLSYAGRLGHGIPAAAPVSSRLRPMPRCRGTIWRGSTSIRNEPEQATPPARRDFRPGLRAACRISVAPTRSRGGPTRRAPRSRDWRNSAAQDFGVGYDLALIHAALGEREPALAALEAAIDDYSQMIGFLNVDPGLDGLRDEPRFRAVVLRLGLA